MTVLPLYLEGDCKTCRGKGQVLKAVADKFPAKDYDVIEVMCADCYGSGKPKQEQ